MDAQAAVDAVAEHFTPLPAPPPSGREDPLGWPGYPEALAQARSRTGQAESVICGRGRVGGVEAVLLAFDFRFIGGSIGWATGDRITQAFQVARRERLPLVSLLCSGGSRMQEGMIALTQLQRATAEIVAARREGIPHISVLRDPTTGGAWACLGAAADVVLAVAGAQVAFAGRRVQPDPGHHAYQAEAQFANGSVDAVLPAAELPLALGAWLRVLRPRAQTPPVAAPLPSPVAAAPGDGWAAVHAARSARRPRAGEYLARYFDTALAISGDRAGGRDPGMLCGIGVRAGQVIAFAAQTGVPTTPAGYRTAVRLVALAERLGQPVLTLIDTPGADPGPRAEAGGLAPAIADLFATIASATVPVTSVVIGEGGSGGALALAAPGRTWITPQAYFSVLAPESAAAVLKRTPDDVPRIADQLRLRPEDLVRLGVVAGIVSYP
jgi:acyl-CoA carboxylase subunit beta